jgi:hypothetical protein
LSQLPLPLQAIADGEKNTIGRVVIAAAAHKRSEFFIVFTPSSN